MSTRRRVALHLTIIVAISVLAVAPVLIAVAAAHLAQAATCTGTGAAETCSLAGISLGDQLDVLSQVGWYAFYTIPLAALAMVIELVAIVLAVVNRR